MSEFTPEQQRQIQHRIDSCSKDWEFVVSTREIQRSRKTGLARWIDCVWRRKYTVEGLYRWIQYQLSTEQYIVLGLVIDRDQIHKRKGYPRAYRLLNGWTIPAKDLSTLTHGPLFDTTGEELVKPGGYFLYYWRRYWPLFTILATIVGFVSALKSF